MKKSILNKIDYNKFYPLFFTVLFIVIVLQYSFSTFEAIFYDVRVKYDIGTNSQDNIVLITLDEESDQFLGESYPYSYTTHVRLLEKLLKNKPSIVAYMLTLPDSQLDEDLEEMDRFKELVTSYKNEGGLFRFGMEMDTWGEQLPPRKLRDLGYSLALYNKDSSIFSRDDVSRRAILDISGDESLHLWVANEFRKLQGLERFNVKDIRGSYYVREAEANFAMFRYSSSPVAEDSNILKVPLHRVVVGNFAEDFFKDKIVLIGSEYISNSSDYILTPFNKEKLSAAKLNVSAEIIKALINNKTIYRVPRWVSNLLAIVLGLTLSIVISRLQPAKGLFITIVIMLSVVCLSYILFVTLGLWIYLSHLVLTVFIVYYIWVPFRAINEYQTRYKFQEESKMLKQVDKLKQNFISLMSHDLKTPVAKISGITEILANQFQNNDDQKRHLVQIMDTTKELNKFITSILDLTKIESKELSIKKVSKDVNKVIDDVIHSLRYEAKEKKVTIDSELAPLYPIQMDTNLLKRVFSNLIENAIKYSGEDSVVRITSEDDADWVYITISDDGVGIPVNDVDHIFEKFYRVKNDASHQIKGSGLGLYLVKYFIELHEGSISVESTPGEGTTFFIQLKNR